MCRRRYRQIVVRRTLEQLRRLAREKGAAAGARAAAPPGYPPPEFAGVRVVTLGSGNLLTDFEILLALWKEGVRIEQVRVARANTLKSLRPD